MPIYNGNASARISGNSKYPGIKGSVTFRQTLTGVLVTANIFGLPDNEENFRNGVYAFHIHSGVSCTGNLEDEFADAGMHYNPYNAIHPYHAGDLPPLFSNNGHAYMQILTDRFKLYDIIGKVIIIHAGTDDFKTQPSGNSGEKIACGRILRNNFVTY